MATWTYRHAQDGVAVGEPVTEHHDDLTAAEFAAKVAAMPRPFRADTVWVWAGTDITQPPLVQCRRHPRRRALAVA